MTSDWSQVRIEKLTIYEITLYIFGARVKIHNGKLELYLNYSLYCVRPDCYFL